MSCVDMLYDEVDLSNPGDRNALEADVGPQRRCRSYLLTLVSNLKRAKKKGVNEMSRWTGFWPAPDQIVVVRGVSEWRVCYRRLYRSHSSSWKNIIPNRRKKKPHTHMHCRPTGPIDLLHQSERAAKTASSSSACLGQTPLKPLPYSLTLPYQLI